jgi:alginate O-acetyltransferase complex protein AlgI
MTLPLIFISILVAGITGFVTNNRLRIMLLLGLSTLAVYAFQPVLPVRGLDFWLPTATLAITTLTWILTTPREQHSWRINWPAAATLTCIVLALGTTRFLGISFYLTASRPPQIIQIISGIAIVSLGAFLLARISESNKVFLTYVFLFIILIFVVLKIPVLAFLVSKGLRSLNHQSTSLALAQDIRWLGFSYIAFRLLHTIRDRQNERLPVVSLAEYIIYVIFFPALSAGPIDRIERFIGDLRSPQLLSGNDLGEAGKRLLLGLFKKFVIADLLAMIAMNPINSLQVRSTGWAWVLLYAYAFQIFFDFSGYTDIAIGLGRLLGIKLPENFNSPYLKPNLTKFWNNWHISLTQWFRAYFFNPLTRFLRSRKKQLPIPVIIFVTQVGTMCLIGFWHGVTINFLFWGLWHGIGLFTHNRWSELSRARFAVLPKSMQTVLNVGGVLLTFNYIALGWTFFAIPGISNSFHFFGLLFGLT